ncbi:cilia- and flagella-associated protein 299-like [Uranotaenia lowii]|uniref:cilia- and flagella-associated protein 299-like n=1 Tax=Uranotaenia lowii TaxID=190385 RepID=UPI00247A2835|nr:cilia- and flagella-associated protein 299-like [Uranotaenia lowii]
MKLSQDDVYILDFTTYEEYLKSLISTQDIRYLGHKLNGLRLHKTGYRALTKDAFESKRREIAEYVHASQDPSSYYSRGLVLIDPILHALVERERGNRVGMISTIIFVRYMRNNAEISGYIDYEHALTRVNVDKQYGLDWKAIFQGEEIIRPSKFDLSYYNALVDKTTTRNSPNYRILYDKEIIFQNLYDRKYIYPDPLGSYYGTNTTRTDFESDVYEQFALYDHVIVKNF